MNGRRPVPESRSGFQRPRDVSPKRGSSAPDPHPCQRSMGDEGKQRQVILRALAFAGVLAAAQVAIIAAPWSATAQTLATATQELVVSPGWNVVFLKVSAPREQVEQVLRDGKISRIVVRATEPGPITSDAPSLESEGWGEDAYLWTSRDVDFDDNSDVAESARVLQAGHCYILRSSLEQPAGPIILEGPPVHRRQVWRGMDGALFGASVGGDRKPSIAAYFAPSPVLGGEGGRASIYETTEFYMLKPKGGWNRLEADQLSVETMDESKCLFIRVPGWTDYQGPLEATVETGDALTFSNTATERTLQLSNRTRETVEVELKSPRFASDGEASGGDLPLPALFVRLPELSVDSDPWIGIDENGLRLGIPARSSRYLRLGANLAAAQKWRQATAVDAFSGTPIRSVLTLEGAGGLFLSVPVSITLGSGPDGSSLTGLWTGDVTVDHVSFAGIESVERRTVQPVGTPFRFRILLHRSSDGTCRLLSEAFELRNTVGGEDTFVLLTDEATALRLQRSDNVELRRRFGTAAYTTAGAIPAETGNQDQVGQAPCLSTDSVVSFRIVLEHDDPRHPDVHARHPHHDNLDERFEERVEEGVESSRIERRFSFSFAPPSGAGSYSPYRGESRRHGIFEEEISGIHRWPLQTKGSFELRRVSRADLREEER